MDCVRFTPIPLEGGIQNSVESLPNLANASGRIEAMLCPYQGENAHEDFGDVTTAEDIRSAFRAGYPDVDDDEFSVEHSGFGHEHPMTAIGVVLISSVLLGTSHTRKTAYHLLGTFVAPLQLFRLCSRMA